MASYAFSSVGGSGNGRARGADFAPASVASRGLRDADGDGHGVHLTQSQAHSSAGIMTLTCRGSKGDIQSTDIDEHIASLFPDGILTKDELKTMRRLIMSVDEEDVEAQEGQLPGAEGHGGMRLQDFVANCTNSEVAKLKHLARMFDKNKRKRWFLERLFDPRARKMRMFQKSTTRSDKHIGGHGFVGDIMNPVINIVGSGGKALGGLASFGSSHNATLGSSSESRDSPSIGAGAVPSAKQESMTAL